MNATLHPDHGEAVTDSEVYINGNGYERLLIVKGWRGNPEKQDQLARIHIRVDRYRALSFAKASVWNSTDQSGDGWVEMIRLPVDEWWDRMQGYQRAAGKQAEIDTRLLAEDVIDELQSVLV